MKWMNGFGRLPQALAIAGMVSTACAASAWGRAGDNGQYFMIEGLYLERDDTGGDAFTQDAGGGVTPFQLITADDVAPEGSGGLRVTAQFDAFGQKWQASAFGVVPFDGEVFVSGLDPNGAAGETDATYANILGQDVNTSNSEEFHAIDAHLESELWGAEFSWVKNLGGYGMNNIDLLAGVRFIRFGDELTTVIFDEEDDLITPDFVDRVGINVENNLVGLQIGLQGMWDVSSSVSIGGSIKGGIAANFVTRDRSFSSDNDALNGYSNGNDDTGFAQFAEFNPRVDVALSDTATLSIGGTVLWLNDVSEAPSHFQTVSDRDDANIRDDDDELIYGASIGLKLALN